MRLAEFIVSNIEPILAGWEAFAHGIWPPDVSDAPAALRDHAEQILRAAAQDMTADQSEADRSSKSKGNLSAADNDSLKLNGASTEHGTERVAAGFKLGAVVAEYCALRASVIRLWRDSSPSPDLHDIDDLTRFGEAIDQSLAKAVQRYTDRVERSRQLFLAILGHDLRNPLNAMIMSGRGRHPPRLHRRGFCGNAPPGRVQRRGHGPDDQRPARLHRRRPGRRDAGDTGTDNLADVSRDVLEKTRAAHPKCTVRYAPSGDLSGEWDAARIRQLISNLIGNAIQHGAEGCEVGFSVSGDGSGVTIAVRNAGPPIPPGALTTIFDPLVRLASAELIGRRRPGSIGLGLYVAREVANAHGGTIGVTSTEEDGTTFTVRLPR